MGAWVGPAGWVGCVGGRGCLAAAEGVLPPAAKKRVMSLGAGLRCLGVVLAGWAGSAGGGCGLAATCGLAAAGLQKRVMSPAGGVAELKLEQARNKDVMRHPRLRLCAERVVCSP